MKSPFFDTCMKSQNHANYTISNVQGKEKSSHKFLISVNSPFLKIKCISSSHQKAKNLLVKFNCCHLYWKIKESVKDSQTVSFSINLLWRYKMPYNETNANFKNHVLDKERWSSLRGKTAPPKFLTFTFISFYLWVDLCQTFIYKFNFLSQV